MQVRILVVEDDALQASVLTSMLEARGFFVDAAGTGVEALRKVRTGWFDLVLMDFSLPEIDGLAAAQLIAALTKATGRPRLVGLTASPQSWDPGAAAPTHIFDAVEAKPWDPDTLVATLLRCHAAAPPARHGWLDLDAALNSRFGGASRQDTDPAPAGCLRVLVADDDVLWRSVLVAGLESLGHTVFAARDGLEALRDVSSTPYDIVITDYRMPQVDGIAAARLIFDIVVRANRPRLIALTASPELLHQQIAGQPDLFDEVVGKSAGMTGLLAAFERCAAYIRRPRPEAAIRVMELATAL